MSLTIHHCRAVRRRDRQWTATCWYTWQGDRCYVRATGRCPGPMKRLARNMARRMADPRPLDYLLREALAKLPPATQQWGGKLITMDHPGGTPVQG